MRADEITEERDTGNDSSAEGGKNNPLRIFWAFLKRLGPGVVTGASDDDPGGIATYSSVGAAFGTQLLWMALWQLPMMSAVQEACARIGIVTREGLAASLQKRYSRITVGVLVMMLVVANVANIGADIQAMAASIRLVLPVNFVLSAVIIAIVMMSLEILVPYEQYSKYLKYLTVTLFAYVITGFLTDPSWARVVKDTLVPSISFDREYLFAMIAVFGTTISPYLFFWQASQEVEQQAVDDESGSGNKAPQRRKLKNMRKDVFTGMLLSQVVMLFIIITTSQTLHENGITNVESAQQAANALKPLAGGYASLLFAAGIITTGLLAVPVLAGASAYALAELFRLREGLGKKFTRARVFYLLIVLAFGLGLLLNLVGINAIKALYYSAFINGLVSVPILFLLLRLGDDPRIMGAKTNPVWVKVFGWAAFAFAGASIATIAVLYMI